MESIDEIVDYLVIELKAVMDQTVAKQQKKWVNPYTDFSRGYPEGKLPGSWIPGYDKFMKDRMSQKDAATRHKQATEERNKLAVKASTDNWTNARELSLLPNNSTVPDKLNELYEQAKKLEDKFNNELGEAIHTLAGWCHGEAKEFYYKAILQCKKMGLLITRVNISMVSRFTNTHARPGENSFNTDVVTKSGYARTTLVEAELHTKISAEAKASATNLATTVEGSIGAEVAASIKGSSTITNSAERTTTDKINLSLCSPVYVYQTNFAALMADGTTISGWGTGHIVSPVPIDV